jgi:hypothetical protein
VIALAPQKLQFGIAVDVEVGQAHGVAPQVFQLGIMAYIDTCNSGTQRAVKVLQKRLRTDID